jgi:hypothetical protein
MFAEKNHTIETSEGGKSEDCVIFKLKMQVNEAYYSSICTVQNNTCRSASIQYLKYFPAVNILHILVAKETQTKMKS